MVYDIVFTKGAYTVNLYANSVSQEISNKLVTLSLATTETNQAVGAKSTKILDLLRITHQFIIKVDLTGDDSMDKSAKQIKDDLKSIATGADTDGGEVTMTYDGDPYTGYLEKVVATKSGDDTANESSDQVRKYELEITFVVGISATSS